MPRDRDLDLIREAVAALSGDFDSVHIFATRVSPREEGTVNVQYGCGNWFARYGQVVHWVKTTDATDAKDATERDADS